MNKVATLKPKIVEELVCDPPRHTIKSSEGADHDEFEFVCTKGWHEIFVTYSYDRSSARFEDDPRTRRAIVQVGALASLCSGLVSWAHKGYIMVDANAFKMHQPIHVNDTIKIVMTADDKTSLKKLTIEVFAKKDKEWVMITETSVRLIRTLLV